MPHRLPYSLASVTRAAVAEYRHLVLDALQLLKTARIATFCAGSIQRSEDDRAKMPMIAITTKSSIRVKPDLRDGENES